MRPALKQARMDLGKGRQTPEQSRSDLRRRPALKYPRSYQGEGLFQLVSKWHGSCRPLTRRQPAPEKSLQTCACIHRPYRPMIFHESMPGLCEASVERDQCHRRWRCPFPCPRRGEALPDVEKNGYLHQHEPVFCFGMRIARFRLHSKRKYIPSAIMFDFPSKRPTVLGTIRMFVTIRNGGLSAHLYHKGTSNRTKSGAWPGPLQKAIFSVHRSFLTFFNSPASAKS
jgi:hypothetical protein